MGITGSQKAPLYALSNLARSGATRSGYHSAASFIWLGGKWVGSPPHSPGLGTIRGVTIESLTITDELNETPNTCSFRIIGGTTTAGTEVAILLGSQNGVRLFSGHVLTVTQSYFEKPVNIRADVSAVDYSWQFGFVKVTKAYGALSASTMALDLLSIYAPGFNGLYIAPDLPTIPEMTFTNENLGDAFSRIAARIGGYWYVDYTRQVHLFINDVGDLPDPLVPTHKSLANLRLDTDMSQVLTRVYVEGRGSTLLAAVAAGETRLPVEAVDMFGVFSDVFLKASFQGSSGGAQHLNFDGVVTGGGGAIIGPGVTPGAAPAVLPTFVTGAAVTPGTHGYVYTYVTAAGESLQSVSATVALGTLANPLTAAEASPPNTQYIGKAVKGGRYKLKYAYATSGGKVTLPSPESLTAIASSPTISSGGSAVWYVPRSPDPAVTILFMYTTTNNGTVFYQDGQYVHTAGTGTMTVQNGIDTDAVLATNPLPPTTNTFTQNQVNLSGLAAGPTGVTSRKVYRTAAGAGQLKLLTTLADNTTLVYADKLADAALGANAPTSDTSGLKQPEGQVNPGATVIRVSSTAAFEAGGGWAVIGNGEQVIRYAAVTADSLTGIPASGIGSVTAVIVYNSTITAAPMLTGIPASGTRALTRGLTEGDELYLVVQTDETERQTALAALVGGNGIREEWVQDRRLSIAEARARGNATLAQRMLPQTRLSYTCRDLKTRAGLDIWTDLPAPTSIGGPFKIQHVTISNFRGLPNQYPTFTVEASTSRFSFEDLLRVASRDVAR